MKNPRSRARYYAAQSQSNTLNVKLGVVLAISSSLTQAYAANATGPAGMQGIPAMLLMVFVYPVIGIALAWLFFKITNKAWVFLFAPMVPVAIGAASSPTTYPGFLSFAGMWFYWAHIAGVVLVYLMFAKRKKVWLFFLAPLIGWIIQFISFLAIV